MCQFYATISNSQVSLLNTKHKRARLFFPFTHHFQVIFCVESRVYFRGHEAQGGQPHTMDCLKGCTRGNPWNTGRVRKLHRHKTEAGIKPQSPEVWGKCAKYQTNTVYSYMKILHRLPTETGLGKLELYLVSNTRHVGIRIKLRIKACNLIFLSKEYRWSKALLHHSL